MLRDVRHHQVQKSQAVPITGQPKFVGVRNTALMLVCDHDARRVRSQGGTDLVGLVVADANDPSVLVEIEVPDPAADMATQIDPAFLHTRDRAVIGGTACQLLTHASTFDQEGGAKVLLKHRLHHRAATDVANTDTENLFHHPMMFRWLTPSRSGAKGRLPDGFSIGDDSITLASMSKLLLIRHCQSTGTHPDAPLSDAGAKAAEALITRLRDLAPDAVYSSPYERAQATVRPFAISAGLSVGLDDRLRERVLSDRELENRWDHVRRSFAEPDYRAPGGESLNQTAHRAIAALTDIAAAGHRLAAVASHRNLIASVLRSLDTAFGFEQLLGLRTPDLFEVELDAGRPIRFVRLDALRRFEGQ